MDLVNISNRLPVTLGKTIRKSSGGLVTAMENLNLDLQFRWIGWPGNYIDGEEAQDALTAELVSEYDYIPLFLSRKDIAAYYQGFSNSSLWPVFHYMPNLMQYKESWWDSYVKVNQLFCRETLKYLHDDTVVWIHDYHLMLLPRMLREERPGLKIGFFLHTPFPSYEVFRCHPNREQLVEGLLGADLVGFHTYGYVRHFRSAVLRLLGYESDMNVIYHEHGNTHTNVFPIGINASKFLDELQSKTYKRKLKQLTTVYKGKKIVLSVERLDYTKGIRRRLDAIDAFLKEYKDKDSIVFIFISVPSRGDVKEYRLFIEEVESLVGKINGTHATVENIPVHFMHKSINFHELCALYALADVALVTPLFDGMNLVAKEYIVCQNEGKGMLILSEFAGAADELFGAEIVNPYNINQLVSTLSKALSMGGEEKQKRMETMRKHVITYDSTHWAKSFLLSLQQLDNERVHTLSANSSMDEIVEVFAGKSSCALFLDYDGTLREFEDVPGAASPTDEIYEILGSFADISGVDLFIISGRKREDLERWFKDFPCTLIAEHGLVYMNPGASTWEHLGDPPEQAWKSDVLALFHQYEGMCPGSLTEEKSSSIVWHYRRCDPELGKIKANQLLEELYELLAKQPLEVHQGHKIIEVSSMYVNKGASVRFFTDNKHYDVVFCAGDDYTDESMFQVELQNQLSVKVGAGTTRAGWRVKDPRKLQQLLHGIAAELK